MLAVSNARDQILGRVRAVSKETVGLADAQWRVLATTLKAKHALPPWDNSAMDGFAVRLAELPATLPVAGSVFAGDAPGESLAPGTTLRIMTGAPVPAGADAVVMREDVADHDTSATFTEQPREGQHIRRRGEDIADGETLLEQGTDIGPGEIGLLAAQAIETVEVARRPRVAVLATGDELVPLGTTPQPGQHVNSSSLSLAAQLRDAGAEAVSLGIAGDDLAQLTAKIREGLSYDVLLTTGGVSAGDHDFVREAMAAAGVSAEFWKVAVKPGKPLAFGVAEDCLVFGLPGNPISSSVSFELFVRPALRKMQGATSWDRRRVTVRLASDVRKKPGRAHYVRARLSNQGPLTAHVLRQQSSGALSSMRQVDALVELAAELGTQEEGALVPAILLDGK